MLTLNDVYGIDFSSINLSGIMDDLSIYTEFKVPWQSIYGDNSTHLNLAFYMRYGKRAIPSSIRSMIENNADNKLSAEQRKYIAIMLFKIYDNKWQKEWDTRSVEYEPLQNYNMTETENGTVEHTGTDKQSGTITTETSGQADDQVYGYNSTDPVDNGKTSTTGNGTDTRDLTDTKDLTDTTNRNLTRSGNIGVTTSQQMLQAERDVWMWDYFLQVVFPDIANFLTIPIYK